MELPAAREYRRRTASPFQPYVHASASKASPPACSSVHDSLRLSVRALLFKDVEGVQMSACPRELGLPLDLKLEPQLSSEDLCRCALPANADLLSSLCLQPKLK